MRISQIVARHLNHYVYTLSDPETKEVFYVGKGKGGRCLQHSDDGDGAKAKKLKELKKRGKEPRIDILVHGLESEEMAFRVEAAAIDLIGKDKLVNEVRGWGSREYGKAELSKLIAISGRRGDHSPRPPTPPDVRFRIRRFMINLAKPADGSAVRRVPEC